MAKFTKKPKVILAEKWDGKNLQDIKNLIGADNAELDGNGGLIIKIHRGSMFVSMGHYIVQEDMNDEPKLLSAFKFNLLYSPIKK